MWPRLELVRGIDETWMFTESCKYHFKNADGTTHDDQWDWNKLTGIGFSIDAMDDAAMIGWRFNPDTDRFELGAYAHGVSKKGDREMVEFCVEIEAEEKFSVRVLFMGNDQIFFFEIEAGGFIISDFRSDNICIGTRKKRGLGYAITNWFGGQQTPPHDMEMFFKKN